MNEEIVQQLITSAEKLAHAAESIDRAVSRLDGHQDGLMAKVDRIIAAIDEHALPNSETDDDHKAAQDRIAELERANAELKAQAERLSRKTLSPLASSLLAKSCAGESERLDRNALDKALKSLSVDQRIAVKAEMARAGLLE